MQKSFLRAWDGDIVRVSYTLSLKDGPVFGSSTDPLPFEFMIGRGAVLPAFENAVVGMMLKVCTDGGIEIEGQVPAADEHTITIDENHEFAGKELVFGIRLLKIIRPG